jgi:hypothetical protein
VEKNVVAEVIKLEKQYQFSTGKVFTKFTKKVTGKRMR